MIGMYTNPARWLSLTLAAALAVLVTVYPPAIAHMPHGEISLVIWGICAGFVHGMGFDPENRYWRALFSPWIAWLLMGLGIYGMVHG